MCHTMFHIEYSTSHHNILKYIILHSHFLKWVGRIPPSLKEQWGCHLHLLEWDVDHHQSLKRSGDDTYTFLSETGCRRYIQGEVGLPPPISKDMRKCHLDLLKRSGHCTPTFLIGVRKSSPVLYLQQRKRSEDATSTFKMRLEWHHHFLKRSEDAASTFLSEG